MEPRLAFADEREREMCQRGEVSRCSHRPARRDLRQDAAVQAVEEQLDRLDACAGVPFRECVRAQEHRRTYDGVGVRIADATGVRPKQPELQLLGQLLRNRARDEPAEPCVHAVRVLAAAVRHPLDNFAGGAHAPDRILGQSVHLCAVDRDRPHIGQLEAFAVQREPYRHPRECSDGFLGVGALCEP